MASFRVGSLRKPVAGASLLSSEAIGARLDDLERKMERLRALYESFFLGVERRPPQIPRQELNRLMLEVQQLSIRNAALRFRFQALGQRWTLMTTYWNRTLREIESGTYRRDMEKAYRRIAARGTPLSEEEAAALGIPVGRAKAFVSQQNRRWGPAAVGERTDGAPGTAPALTPPPRVAPTLALASPPVAVPARTPERAAGPASLAPPVPDSDEGAQIARLHQAYAAAHATLARAGASSPPAPPSLEQLRAKVLPHLSRLRAAHPEGPIELSAVVQDGRVVIRTKRGA